MQYYISRVHDVEETWYVLRAYADAADTALPL